MAAVDVPWLEPMSTSSRDQISNLSARQDAAAGDPPTYAAFSPAHLGHPSIAAQRSTILVHQKSPLLVSTPPQITRALAYSNPFISPLSRIFGLLSWTSGDSWESFLLVAAFWAVTLYGDVVLRWAGPVALVAVIILGMYARRYSSLSSTSWTGEKAGQQQEPQPGHKRGASDVGAEHYKSLDEIVEELKLFTSRCNILMDPALRLTDFLSTQQTATSATTRPALTALFIRILFVSPVWFILTLPPLSIITTQRVVLAVGTVALTWHSRPARVTRTLLWRSRTIHRICGFVTGLDFSGARRDGLGASATSKNANEIAAALTAKRGAGAAPGIRFTFTIYENQRRWLGIGWTSSMLAYERASWTDEEMNASASKDNFKLPEVQGGHARWRWIDGSKWHVEGADGEESGDEDDKGWVYYDNKWRNGRRDKDGWGRYTRRRKWCRDAELVEVTSSTELTPAASPKIGAAVVDGEDDGAAAASEVGTEHNGATETPPPAYAEQAPNNDGGASAASGAKRRRWFRRSSGSASVMTAGAGSVNSAGQSSGSTRTGGDKRRDDDEDDVHSPLHHRERDNDWGLGDDARMNLG